MTSGILNNLCSLIVLIYVLVDYIPRIKSQLGTNRLKSSIHVNSYDMCLQLFKYKK